MRSQLINLMLELQEKQGISYTYSKDDSNKAPDAPVASPDKKPLSPSSLVLRWVLR